MTKTEAYPTQCNQWRITNALALYTCVNDTNWKTANCTYRHGIEQLTNSSPKKQWRLFFLFFYLLLLCRYIVFFNEPFTDQISRCSSISWRQRQRFSVLIVQTGDSISLAVIVLSQKSFEVCLSRLLNPYFFGVEQKINSQNPSVFKHIWFCSH